MKHLIILNSLPGLWLGMVLLFLLPACGAMAEEDAWNARLKPFYFQDQLIEDGKDVIGLETPVRAEDGAMVPTRILAKIPQTPERYISDLWLIIDKNPSPLAGHFQLTPRSGKADMELRIRVDAYSPVRVVARTSDGRLHMTERFVKASGGCSAPAGTDLESAMKRLGKIRIKTRLEDTLLNPVATTLAISHPNITGLQKDQVTTLYIPPHYVKSIKVEFDGETIFNAETDISISENPNFRFYFIPGQEGTLTATITDTEGKVFTQQQQLTGTAPSPS